MTVKTPITIVAALLAVLAFAAAPALAAAPETPATREAKSIMSTSAALHGEVNPGLGTEKVAYHFDYSAGTECTASGMTAPVEPFPEAEGNHKLVTEPVSGLEPNTQYSFCLIAANPAEPAESAQGDTLMFTTSRAAPTVVSVSTPSVTPFEARLEGVVNPSNETASCEFEYGTTTAYGTKAPCEQGNALEGGEQSVGVNVAGLTQSTAYHYRLVLKNATGSTKASEGTGEFKTLVAEKPTVEAPSASIQSPFEVYFEAQIDPDYQETSFVFEYSKKASGGKLEGTITTLHGSGTLGGSVQGVAIATGPVLEANTTYYYRAIATNKTGTTEGAIETVTTPALTKPVIESESAPAVSLTEAKLETVVNPDYQETSCVFEYGTESKLEHGTTIKACNPANLGSGNGGAGASAVLTGLTPHTTYYYRVSATNKTGTSTDSTIEEFKTESAPPVIDGESVSNVTQTGATFEAQIESKYQETTYVFEYAPQEPEGESVLLEGHGTKVAAKSLPAGSIAAGTGSQLASAQVTGLAPNTTYYYRVVATNAAGTAPQIPTVATFTTSSVPTVTTGDASGVTATTATLAGTVTPGGLPTTYYFQYGGTDTYGKQTPGVDAGAGATPVSVGSQLGGLEPGVTYHYRIVATNDDKGTTQTTYGEDQTFTTPATPLILTGLSAQGVTQTTATIIATLDPQGLPARYELQLGATQGRLQSIASGETSTTTELSLPVGSLSPGTTYYYKLLATTSNGTLEPEGSFTTAPAPAGAAPGSLPALIPYQSIAELNAKEAKEDKGITTPKALTNAEKLKKALKACKRDKKKSKRALCERTAHKKYPTVKKKAKAKKK